MTKRFLVRIGLPAFVWPATAYGQVGHLGGAPAGDVSLVRVVASFVLCIGVAVTVIVLLRGRGLRWPVPHTLVRRRSAAIDIVETRRLSPHADISLVQHDGQEYLLLLLAGDAKVLRERPLALSEISDA